MTALKKAFLLLCIAIFTIALLAACGRSDPPPPVPTYEMSIRWGYGYGGHNVPELPPGTEIVNRISSTFRVSIIPEPIPVGHDEYSPPNIFESSSNPHELLQRQITRTIPMDMIYRYAYNYYRLLMSVPFGLDVYTDHATGDLVGLPIYHGNNDELQIYSAYRLDWLERHNIPLPNNVVPIREGQIYFTPTPFTKDQFVEIMGAFSREPGAEFGFAIANYSTSDTGRWAVIPPYREDIYGEFTERYLELTERYGEELMRIRERFYLQAIGGQIDIESEWSRYLDELNENGLQQFLALVEQFPTVGR